MKRAYGASPVHLALHALSFALAGWAILQLFDVGRADNVLLWFVGSVVLHDALLWPFYSVLDQAGRIAAIVADRLGPRSAVNYIRVPVALSLLLGLIYLPALLGYNAGNQARVGLEGADHSLERWLIASAVMCMISAGLWILRARRAGALRPHGR